MESGEELPVNQCMDDSDEQNGHITSSMDGNGLMAAETNTSADHENVGVNMNGSSESINVLSNGTAVVKNGSLGNEDHSGSEQLVDIQQDVEGSAQTDKEKKESEPDSGGSPVVSDQIISEDQKMNSETSSQVKMDIGDGEGGDQGSVEGQDSEIPSQLREELNVSMETGDGEGEDQGSATGHRSEINNNFEKKMVPDSNGNKQNVDNIQSSPVHQNPEPDSSQLNGKLVESGNEQDRVVSPSTIVLPDGDDSKTNESCQKSSASSEQEINKERSLSPDLSDLKDSTVSQILSVCQDSEGQGQTNQECQKQDMEGGSGKPLQDDDEDADTVEGDTDTVEGDTDTSQFAQLIVQHVLGHAVSSFNESDHELSPHDTMDEGSLSSFPADEVYKDKPLESSTTLHDDTTEILSTEDIIQADDVKVNESKRSVGTTEEQPLTSSSMESTVRSVSDKNEEINDGDTKVAGAFTIDLPEDDVEDGKPAVDNTTSDNDDGLQYTDIGRNRTSSLHSSCDPSCGLPICPPLAAYPDFPENYGNYKVCREIGPGMKECLILETGENVQCKKIKDGILLRKSDKASEQIVLSEKEAQRFLEKLSDENEETSNRVTPTQDPSLASPKSSAHGSPASQSSDSSRHKSFRIVKTPPKSSPPTHMSVGNGREPTQVNRELFSEGHTSFHRQDMEKIVDAETDNTVKSSDMGDNSAVNFSRKHPRDDKIESVHTPHDTRYDTRGHSSHQQEVSWGERTGYIVRALSEESTPTAGALHQQICRPQNWQQLSADKSPQRTSHRPASPRIDPRILQSSTGYIHREPITDDNNIHDQGLLESTTQHLPIPGQQLLPEPTHVADPYLYQRHFTEAPQSKFSHDSNSFIDRDSEIPVRLPVTVGSDTQSYHLNSSDPQVYQHYQENLVPGEVHQYNVGYRDLSYSSRYQESPSVSHTYAPVHLSQELDRSRNITDNNFMELRVEPPQMTQDLTEAEKQYIAQLCNKYGLSNQPPYDLPYTSPNRQEGHSSAELSASSVPSSGPVPSYKTLQEQQASWMQMFETLEEKHQDELKQQFRQHQHNIFNMQHKMEEELYEQQQELRRKLKVHKEALSVNSSMVVSPGRNESSRSQVTRSLDQSKNTSHDTSDQSAYISPVRGREQSPSWRDIYREVRSEMDRTDPITDSVSVRRSLEKDFSTSSRSRSLLSPSRIPGSPESRTRSQSSPPRASGSPSRSPHSRSLSDGRAETENLPRAGVYSSPMPILRGKTSKQKEAPALSKSSGSPSQSKTSARVNSPSPSEIRQSSSLQRELESRHESLVQQQKGLDEELFDRSASSDDVHLSSSLRVSLREKHAKHMADLREYYERELHAMRQVLKMADSERSNGHGSLSESQNLQLENRLLRGKINDLEDSLEISDRRVRELEQRLQGLEVRASDYADYYKEAQDKIASFRRTVEDLQYDCREKDNVIERITIDYKTQSEALKKSRKKQDEQANLIQKDSSALQELAEKFEESERESNLMKESITNLENKLYDARGENVDMKRTISRLELENKRLSRENDNLHHKVTNLSSVHNSFNESFGTYMPTLSMESPRQRTSHDTSSRQLARDVSPFRLSDSEAVQRRSSREITPQRSQASEALPQALSHDTHEMNGSFHSPNDFVRIRTPTKSIRRSPRPGSHDQTETNQREAGTDSSPIMRAEEELYRLRDVLCSTTPTSCDPVQPKIQKKFYGSDIVSRHSDRSPERYTEIPKSRKKYSNSPSRSSKSRSKDSKFVSLSSESVSVPHKTKPSDSRKSQQLPSKEQSSQTDTDGGRYKQRLSRSAEDHRSRLLANEENSRATANGQQVGNELPPDSTGITWSPSKLKVAVNGRVKSSGSSIGEDGKKKKRRVRRVSKSPMRRCGNNVEVCKVQDPADNKVEKTLQKVKAGEYMSRPKWEDTYTSMAKGLSSTGQPVARESRIKERIKSLNDMEHRYDDLNMEKRKLESALSKVPSSGRNWKQREQLEDHLDKVERELGSIKMSLKRHNILKTS